MRHYFGNIQMKNIIIMSLLFLLNTTTVFAFSVDAPISAENGGVVPIRINSIVPPLKSNEELKVLLNGKSIFIVKPQGDARLNKISLRIRMFETGYVEVQRFHNGKKSESNKSSVIKILNSATIPNSGSSKAIVKTKIKDTRVLLLLKHEMAASRYIKHVHLDTSAGSVSIQLTPNVSENPFITFGFDSQVSNPSYQIAFSNDAQPSWVGESTTISAPKVTRSATEKNTRACANPRGNAYKYTGSIDISLHMESWANKGEIATYYLDNAKEALLSQKILGRVTNGSGYQSNMSKLKNSLNRNGLSNMAGLEQGKNNYTKQDFIDSVHCSINTVVDKYRDDGHRKFKKETEYNTVANGILSAYVTSFP